MTTTRMLADMKIKMQSLRIPHPRLEEAQGQMHALRLVGNGSRRRPQRILPILGPSGSGKSMVITDLREQVALRERPAERCHPILHVTLSAKASVKQLGADIIDALQEDGLPEQVVAHLLGPRFSSARQKGDPVKSVGENRLMQVATELLALAGVELLVIDEVHHLVHSDGAKRTAWSVSEALKKLAITGVCPLVLVGVQEARRIISMSNNPQIVTRCEEPVIFAPLDIADREDAETFANYVRALEMLLVADGVFPEVSGLDRRENVACLYDVSAGVIGTVSRLVEAAAGHAIRRGGRHIDPEDLSRATRTWAIPLNHTDHDPWTGGPRDLRTVKAAREGLWRSGPL